MSGLVHRWTSPPQCAGPPLTQKPAGRGLLRPQGGEGEVPADVRGAAELVLRGREHLAIWCQRRTREKKEAECVTWIPQWLEYCWVFLKKELDKNIFLILSRLAFHSAEVLKSILIHKYLKYLENGAEFSYVKFKLKLRPQSSGNRNTGPRWVGVIVTYQPGGR